MSIALEIKAAVDAIERATDQVKRAESGIDSMQIQQLRRAIDDLETVLNEKKRKLDAYQF